MADCVYNRLIKVIHKKKFFYMFGKDHLPLHNHPNSSPNLFS